MPQTAQDVDDRELVIRLGANMVAMAAVQSHLATLLIAHAEGISEKDAVVDLVHTPKGIGSALRPYLRAYAMYVLDEEVVTPERMRTLAQQVIAGLLEP